MDIDEREDGKRKNIEVFCCYAREDLLMLEEIKSHLKSLVREELITLWTDGDIDAGMEWEKEIHHHLDTAQIILLLISSDFMASEYCYGVEMQHAMKRHESGKAFVIPIILRPVSWQKTPFARLQALPTGAKPISEWPNPDKAFLTITNGIRKVATKVRRKTSAHLLLTQEKLPSALVPQPQNEVLSHTSSPYLRRRWVMMSILSLMLIIAAVFAINVQIQIITAKNVSASLSATGTAAAKIYATVTGKGIEFGFNSAHTHWNPYEQVLNKRNVDQLTPLWSSPISGWGTSVAGKMVYVASADGNLYAFDASCRHNCQPLWSYLIGPNTGTSPAIASGMVYTGSADGNLYAFDASCQHACQPLWSYHTGGPIYSSPTVANGVVYIGSNDHRLYAFDASCQHACQPLWSYKAKGNIGSSPAVANGMVYVGSDDHNLYAFDASCRHDCQPLWFYQTSGSVYSSPADANGIVYVGSLDGNFYAFDASCQHACQPLWSYQTFSDIYSSPAVANGIVYVGSTNHVLYAFNANCRSSTCQPFLWSFLTEGDVRFSPTIANGVLYIGSDDYRLYAFDASCQRGCQPLWSYQTDGRVASPVVANGMVYINTDRYFYAFGLPEEK